MADRDAGAGEARASGVHRLTVPQLTSFSNGRTRSRMATSAPPPRLVVTAGSVHGVRLAPLRCKNRPCESWPSEVAGNRGGIDDRIR